MRRAHLAALLLLLLHTTGCAPSARSGEPGSRRQENVITSEEIVGAQFRSAYDLIQALRPNWLSQPRQQSLSMPGASQVNVYMDNVRTGGIEFLRQVPVTDVASARWLSGTEAVSRFGTGNAGGAILITTRR